MGFSSACPRKPGERLSADDELKAEKGCLFEDGSKRLARSNQDGGMRTKRFAFRKEDRILHRSRFLNLSRRGRRLQNELFILCYEPSQTLRSRIGVTVTKKVAGAVERNRIKRICREFFRQNRNILQRAWDINLIAKRQAANAEGRKISDALDQLFTLLMKKDKG